MATARTRSSSSQSGTRPASKVRSVSVGRREHAEVGDVSIDSKVSLLPTKDRGFQLAVALDVTLPQVADPAEAVRLVAAAHQVCPYSNATRGNVEVVLTANGQGVG